MTNAAPRDFALLKRFTAEYTQASPKTPKKAVYERIAATLGLTADSVRGRVSRARRATEQSARTIQIPSITPPTPDLDAGQLYWPSARDMNDLPEFRAFADSWRRRDRMMKVFLITDMHIPDHDVQAVKLAVQAAHVYQPDLIVDLGDTVDLDKLSTHWERSSARKQGDAFKEAARPWNAVVDLFKQALPNVPFAVLPGNHTQGRVENYINSRAPELDETILENFVELIRAQRRVWWLGWDREYWLRSLMLEHGKETGKNSAAKAHERVSFGVSRVGGHAHIPTLNYRRFTLATESGVRQLVTSSLTLPCLCDLNAHYEANRHKSKEEKKKNFQLSMWINGCATAFINFNDLDVHLTPIIFHTRRDGSMAGVVGAHELIQKP